MAGHGGPSRRGGGWLKERHSGLSYNVMTFQGPPKRLPHNCQFYCVTFTLSLHPDSSTLFFSQFVIIHLHCFWFNSRLHMSYKAQETSILVSLAYCWIQGSRTVPRTL